MPLHTRQGGTWRPIKNVQTRQGGSWRQCKQVWTRQSGVWRPVWTAEKILHIALNQKQPGYGNSTSYTKHPDRLYLYSRTEGGAAVHLIAATVGPMDLTGVNEVAINWNQTMTSSNAEARFSIATTPTGAATSQIVISGTGYNPSYHTHRIGTSGLSGFYYIRVETYAYNPVFGNWGWAEVNVRYLYRDNVIFWDAAVDQFIG